MNRLKYILLFIFMLAWENASAHLGVIVPSVKEANFGNVKVRIEKTGIKSPHAETDKVMLFGGLAAELARQLNYSDPILLDFTRCSAENCKSDCFISYDKGKIKYITNSHDYRHDAQKYFNKISIKAKKLNNNTIVVRQVAEQFDAETTLKLLEYAILNKKKVKSSQKRIKYNQNYICKWKINSIDTTLIKQICHQPNSVLLDNVLSLKTKKRENHDFKSGISYYLQNNKYTIFAKDKKMDTNLLTLDNIYQFERINDSTALIFDSDTSFYFIDKHKISKHQTFQKIFQSFDISTTYKEEKKLILIRLGERYTLNEIFLSWGLFRVKELTYLVEKDELLIYTDAQEIKIINKKIHIDE